MWYKYFIKNTSGKKEFFLGNTVQENMVYMYCNTLQGTWRNCFKTLRNLINYQTSPKLFYKFNSRFLSCSFHHKFLGWKNAQHQKMYTVYSVQIGVNNLNPTSIITFPKLFCSQFDPTPMNLSLSVSWLYSLCMLVIRHWHAHDYHHAYHHILYNTTE